MSSNMCDTGPHRPSDKVMDLSCAAEYLGISRATLMNWLRLGTAGPDMIVSGSPEGSGSRILLSREAVRRLRTSIRNGDMDKLRRRRNKKAVPGISLYRRYMENCQENLKLTERLCSGRTSFSVSEIRSTLRCLSVCLFRKVYSGRPDLRKKFDVLLEDLFPGDKNPQVNLFSDALFIPCQDFLGFVYLSMRHLAERKTAGSYYTPASTVRKMMENLNRTAGDIPDQTGGSALSSRTLDPCCGSGNFLLALLGAGMDPSLLYGTDIDSISVCLTRINLFLNGVTDLSLLRSHFITADYLSDLPAGFPETAASDYPAAPTAVSVSDPRASSPSVPLPGSYAASFGLIIGNPPWGGDVPEDIRRRLAGSFRCAAGKNTDICDIFIEKSVRILKPGGILAFVIPRALLSVRSHQAVRAAADEMAEPVFIDYSPSPFYGVQCPAVLIGLQKNKFRLRGENSGSRECRIISPDGSTRMVRNDRPASPFGRCFTADDREYKILCHMKNGCGRVFLKDHADFALGIVTGRNSQALKAVPDDCTRSEGAIRTDMTADTAQFVPVLRGRDLIRYRHHSPGSAIRFDPAALQQAAPEKYYCAQEKLVYRFICRVPVFSYDSDKLFTLNSANILIPRLPGFRVKYILAVLNSRPVSFWFQKKYDSVKMLRSHIEQIPIPYAAPDMQDEIIRNANLILRPETGQAERIALYCKIDQIIMELYGLAHEEREIISEAAGSEETFL